MNVYIKFSFDFNLIDQNFDPKFDMVPAICRIRAIYLWCQIKNCNLFIYRVDHEFMDNYKVVLIKNQRWYSKKG